MQVLFVIQRRVPRNYIDAVRDVQLVPHARGLHQSLVPKTQLDPLHRSKHGFGSHSSPRILCQNDTSLHLSRHMPDALSTLARMRPLYILHSLPAYPPTFLPFVYRYIGCSECSGSHGFTLISHLSTCLPLLVSWFCTSPTRCSACLPLHSGWFECCRPHDSAPVSIACMIWHFHLHLRPLLIHVFPNTLWVLWVLWFAWFHTCRPLLSQLVPAVLWILCPRDFTLVSHLPLHLSSYTLYFPFFVTCGSLSFWFGIWPAARIWDFKILNFWFSNNNFEQSQHFCDM